MSRWPIDLSKKVSSILKYKFKEKEVKNGEPVSYHRRGRWFESSPRYQMNFKGARYRPA